MTVTCLCLDDIAATTTVTAYRDDPCVLDRVDGVPWSLVLALEEEEDVAVHDLKRGEGTISQW